MTLEKYVNNDCLCVFFCLSCLSSLLSSVVRLYKFESGIYVYCLIIYKWRLIFEFIYCVLVRVGLESCSVRSNGIWLARLCSKCCGKMIIIINNIVDFHRVCNLRTSADAIVVVGRLSSHPFCLSRRSSHIKEICFVTSIVVRQVPEHTKTSI